MEGPPDSPNPPPVRLDVYQPSLDRWESPESVPSAIDHANTEHKELLWDTPEEVLPPISSTSTDLFGEHAKRKSGGGFYVVSLSRATAIDHCTVGNFTDAVTKDLIFTKGNEVHIIRPHAAEFANIRRTCLHGTIVAIELIDIFPGRQSLFVLCNNGQGVVLHYQNDSLHAISRGNLGRCEMAKSEYDITTRRQYICSNTGKIQCVQFSPEFLSVTHPIPFDKFTDFHLYHDSDGFKRIGVICVIEGKNWFLSLNLDMTPHARMELDALITHFIPISEPNTGFLLLGYQCVFFISGIINGEFVVRTTLNDALIKNTTYTCVRSMDKARVLLADTDGRLLVLYIVIQQNSAKLLVQRLGDTSVAATICSYGNDYVFIGSSTGDSQLMQVRVQNRHRYVEECKSIENIAPINDMYDSKVDDRRVIVTASGTGKDGSLRVIKRQLSFDRLTTFNDLLPSNVFPLKYNTSLDRIFLVTSRVTKTIVFQEDDDTFNQIVIPSLSPEPTFYASNIIKESLILQVTSTTVKIAGTPDDVSWKPPTDIKEECLNLEMATSNYSTGDVIVCTRHELFHLRCEMRDSRPTITLKSRKDFQREITCVHILKNEGSGQPTPRVVVVGLKYSPIVSIINIETLKEIGTVTNSGNPISLVFSFFAGHYFLTTADVMGTVRIYIKPDEQAGFVLLRSKESYAKPTLHAYLSGDTYHVIVCSGDPFLIRWFNGSTSIDNLPRPFRFGRYYNSTHYRDCLLINDGDSFFLASLNTSNKAQKFHMGETINKLSFSPNYTNLGMLTTRTLSNRFPEALCVSKNAKKTGSSELQEGRHPHFDNVPPSVISSFVIVDKVNFSPIYSHQFGPYETARCCVAGPIRHILKRREKETAPDSASNSKPTSESATEPDSQPKNDPDCQYEYEPDFGELFFVATSLSYPDKQHPKTGRLVIFEVHLEQENTVKVMAEHRFEGFPLSVELGSSGQVLVSCLLDSGNTHIIYFTLTNFEHQVKETLIDDHVGKVVELKVYNSFVLMASRSVELWFDNGNLFKQREAETVFKTIGVDFLDGSDHLVIGADDRQNLYAIDYKSNDEEDCEELPTVSSLYHFAQDISVVSREYVSTEDPKFAGNYPYRVVFGTKQGAVGMVFFIDDDLLDFYKRLEVKLAEVHPSHLKITHQDYRRYNEETGNVHQFVDGDLIEPLLFCSRTMALERLQGFEQSPEELLQLAHSVSSIYM